MIKVIDKKDCCGCEACVQKCPKHCISFIPDAEGFYYPSVNLSACIDCHLCEKVCPVIQKGTEYLPVQTYAAFNPNDEERMNSSSGGVFTFVAKKILLQKGVVFGAMYDKKWNVVHNYTENISDLCKFRGSKYVQSRVGRSFAHVLNFLKEGRLVLFTGTPCQVKALKLFLKKDYDNLFTLDFVCHGVPSSKVWQQYLHEVLEKDDAEQSSAAGKNTVLSLSLKTASAIADIAFRDKADYGWEKFCFVIRYTLQKSIFLFVPVTCHGTLFML